MSDTQPKRKPRAAQATPSDTPEVAPRRAHKEVNPRTLRAMTEAARTFTTDAIEALADIALNGTSETARIGAANALLDRAWGKAKDRMEISGDGSAPALVVSFIKPGEKKDDTEVNDE